MKKECAVLIPVYKEEISMEERISLKRINAVLKEYPLIYVAPYNLNMNIYLEYIPIADICYFDDVFFDGFDGYNRLLTSAIFYNRFLQYDKILICQTDVFIISDSLKEFLLYDYDYIGAPMTKYKPWENTLYVGNGGFSLRKVESVLRVIGDDSISKENKGNEDLFFSNYGYEYPDKFRVAPFSVALQFAFDQPTIMISYELANKQLPMGIHGWYNYDTSISKEILSPFLPSGFEWKTAITYEKILNTLDKFLYADKKIFFYGAGDVGRIFTRYCKIRNINIDGYIVSDNQIIQQDKTETVFHISDIEYKPEIKVLITISQRYCKSNDFSKLLLEKGITDILSVDATMLSAVTCYLLKNDNTTL